jgi:hypothetical protein
MTFEQARDAWSAMTHAERRAIIELVHGDVAMANLDWAALPPQAHSALMTAMMQPGAALPEVEPDQEEHNDTEPEPDEEKTTPRPGRRRKR